MTAKRSPGAAAFHAGNAAYRAGRVDEAVAHYDDAERQGCNWPSLYENRGTLALRLGDYGRAEADFRAAAAHPERRFARANLAYTLAIIGRKAEARAELDQLLKADDEREEVLARVGKTLVLLQDPVGVDMCRALVERKTTSNAARGDALAALADAAARDGSFAEAARWFDQIEALGNKSVSLYANRARARLLVGDANGARADAEEAVAREGARPYAFALLAEACAATGDAERARDALAIAQSTSDLAPLYLLHVARTHVLLGEEGDAAGVVERIAARVDVPMWLKARLAAESWRP